MGGPLLEANLFVGSKTQRTMVEWIKVFKIVDNNSLTEKCGKESVMRRNFERYFSEFEDTIPKLNLKLAIDYICIKKMNFT